MPTQKRSLCELYILQASSTSLGVPAPRLNYLRKYCANLGYSDHTSDITTPALSISYGASVVEKHFTINKELPGRDNKFALDPKEFSLMVENIRIAEESCIDHGPDPRDIETDTMKNYRGRWGD